MGSERPSSQIRKDAHSDTNVSVMTKGQSGKPEENLISTGIPS